MDDTDGCCIMYHASLLLLHKSTVVASLLMSREARHGVVVASQNEPWDWICTNGMDILGMHRRRHVVVLAVASAVVLVVPLKLNH